MEQKILKFIEQKIAEQSDISEEDVTDFLGKPKADEETYFHLENLRQLGFLEMTNKGNGMGTIRYGLSPRYREYLGTKD